MFHGAPSFFSVGMSLLMVALVDQYKFLFPFVETMACVWKWRMSNSRLTILTSV
jgi:hypothetical protein